MKSSLKSGKVSGRIMDKNLNVPIPYATVIMKMNDQVTIGTITTEDGKFSLNNIAEGTYILEIQFIGYQNLSIPISVTTENNNIKLEMLYLEENLELLEGVEITAERSTIEQKIDRKVINVGKDLATLGGTASDIMSNVPNVDMDQDGNIALRGNSNVRILIDGKPTNIETNQLLQQIPSTSIKKIEIITSPSAKYNPEGMSGIINIILHKNVKIGFNGSSNLGLDVGQEARFNGALNFNYKKGKLNFYGNYGSNFGKSPLDGIVNRAGDNSEEIWKTLVKRKSFLYKFGVDFYLDERNTMSAYTNQNNFDMNILAETNVFFLSNTPRFGQIYESNRENNTAVYNFDYKHDFLKEGHSIGFEADHNIYSASDLSEFTFKNPNETAFAVDDIIDKRTNTTLNLDYTNPLSKTSKLEIGAEARIQRINNDFLTTNLNQRNSGYIYNRDIYSVYGTFGQNFGKLSYQLGARLENYDVKGRFNQDNSATSIFNNQIFSLYPSAFISYIPNKEDQKNTYQLSFNRRVDRPGLGQINPIRVWSSARITNVGNPELIPQFTSSMEFNYTRRLDKGSLTAAIFYREIRDEITRFAFIDPNDSARIFFSYGNNDDNSAYGFELAGNYKPTSWWSFTTSFDLYSQTRRGVAEEELLEVNNVLYNFKMNNSFNITKNLTLQLIGLYRGKNRTLQYDTNAFYYINTGARYKFAQGKGTISVSFNDLFYSRIFAFDGTRPFVQTGEFIRDTRTVFTGLSYRFGAGKNKSLIRKKRDKNEKRADGF